MVTVILIFTINRTYHAAQIYRNTEEADIEKYIKARKCTFCFQILISVVFFSLYTILLAVQKTGLSLLDLKSHTDDWTQLLLQWLSIFVLMILFLVMEYHFIMAVTWKSKHDWQIERSEDEEESSPKVKDRRISEVENHLLSSISSFNN